MRCVVRSFLRHDFQELAVLAAAHSRLFAWGARSLFIGPSFALSAHTNTVAVLACGLDGSFAAAAGEALREGRLRRTRSLFVPAGTLHQLDCGATHMAFLYVDALSLDSSTLQASMTDRDGPLLFGLRHEAAALAVLQRAAQEAAPRRNTREELLAVLGMDRARFGDERVRRSLAMLTADPAGRHSMQALAASVNLSPSRYLHLFKQTTGVPLRRYRLWVRMGAAVRAMARGGSLTEAALEGGFASSAHFSTVFRQMFGLAPSALLRRGFRVEAPAPDAQPPTRLK